MTGFNKRRIQWNVCTSFRISSVRSNIYGPDLNYEKYLPIKCAASSKTEYKSYKEETKEKTNREAPNFILYQKSTESNIQYCWSSTEFLKVLHKIWISSFKVYCCRIFSPYTPICVSIGTHCWQYVKSKNVRMQIHWIFTWRVTHFCQPSFLIGDSPFTFEFTALWVKFKVPVHIAHFCSVYRSQSLAKDSTFNKTDCLSDSISKILESYPDSDIIVAGDYNIHNSNWSTILVMLHGKAYMASSLPKIIILSN